MEEAETSIIKFLGFKRRSRMFEHNFKRAKREYLSPSQDKTEYTFSFIENEMEIDNTDSDSLIIKLDNGDYTLNYSKIPKNNNFIIPERLKERKDDNIFKGWRYIDFIIYFRDQYNTGYINYWKKSPN